MNESAENRTARADEFKRAVLPRPSSHAQARERNGQPAPSVALHIDELVLHGFAPADGHRIADALQTELTRLLTQQGVPQPWRTNTADEALHRASVRLSPNSSPESIGRAIGARLYEEGNLT